MWYAFPQFDGLGQSAISKKYSIKTLDEAKHCLQYPILGPRLVECTTAAQNIDGRTAAEIFPGGDHIKFRSSMTLF
jgi:uncharacterized protein (DUF1810 family)